MPLPRRTLTAMSLLFVMSACKDEDPKPEPQPTVPELSDTPLWQVKVDPSLKDECFGTSVALADFNGDGRKDLAVGTEPCLTNFVAAKHPGRVSFFAGEERFFSKQPVSALMTWTNTHTRTTGRGLRTVAGDVNGDAYADLLVTGQFGASVFLGGPDLGAILTAPAFRVPGNGFFIFTTFVDFNGDGLDDVVSSRAGVLSFYQATPGAEGGTFTLVHTRQGISFSNQGDIGRHGEPPGAVSGLQGGQFLRLRGPAVRRARADARGQQREAAPRLQRGRPSRRLPVHAQRRDELPPVRAGRRPLLHAGLVADGGCDLPRHGLARCRGGHGRRWRAP
jgi:FG-GAP repeat